MKRLVIGTRNKKKLVELRDLLNDLPIEVVDVSFFPNAPEIEETGTTFVENAILKAVGVAKALGEYVLAEDSGLVVPILKGEPGVYSAHYAGTHGDDAGNNAKLLANLADTPDEQRSAYYVCLAMLSDPNGQVIAQTEGRCHGRILREPRGVGGFGYDPLFLVPEFHKSFGELSLRVKQALSHRAKAVNALRPILWKMVSKTPSS